MNEAMIDNRGRQWGREETALHWVANTWGDDIPRQRVNFKTRYFPEEKVL